MGFSIHQGGPTSWQGYKTSWHWVGAAYRAWTSAAGLILDSVIPHGTCFRTDVWPPQKAFTYSCHSIHSKSTVAIHLCRLWFPLSVREVRCPGVWKAKWVIKPTVMADTITEVPHKTWKLVVKRHFKGMLISLNVKRILNIFYGGEKSTCWPHANCITN